jgi:hypothetical protein
MEELEHTDPAKNRVGWYIISNAIVWGAVMIGISLKLRGTGLMNDLLPILGAGAGFSVVILSVLLVRKK